ncbi:integrase core domain-containing protein [Chromohalobacter canadensis]|uniref:integrase core domain-containing protein n=1 Tax=Chromohalobacter canadensis TaxID=141389 RepID=UPI003D695FA1
MQPSFANEFAFSNRWHYRADSGLVVSSHQYTGTVKAYGLTLAFTTPYTPEQKRFFRSLKEECIWLHRFESLAKARVVINRWIRHFTTKSGHISLWTTWHPEHTQD